MKLAFLPLLAALVSSPVWAVSGCTEFYADGVAPVITYQGFQRSTRELCNSAFVVMHSGLTQTPLWSAEHLTRQQVSDARKMKRVDSFHEEALIPSNERASLNSYTRSGYDRGHMTPSGDEPDPRSMFESYSLSNMVPQDSDNNRHLHEGIESAVRTLTLKRGELYVITGPLFLGDHIQHLRGGVVVPTHIFKLIYDPQARLASAYLENNAPGNDYRVISVAELEQLAGINFLPDMDAGSKQQVLDLPTPTPYNDGREQGQERSSSASSQGHHSTALSMLRALLH
jgi:endonuclease G